MGVDSSGTAVTVALIGASAVVLAAVLTAVYMWQLNRRVGKPNGNGNVTQMLEFVVEEIKDVKSDVRHLKAEAQTTRGMVEGMGSDFAVHQREDRGNFDTLFAKLSERDAR